MYLVDFMIRRFRGNAEPKRKAKPGFYKDPRGKANYRFWDGASWTEKTSENLVTME